MLSKLFMSITRRSFLRQTVAASAAFPLFTIAGTKSTGRVLGANEVIRVGVAGIHGRGASHIHAFAGMQGVQVTYLIDPDTRTFAGRSKEVQARGGNTPRTVQDIRTSQPERNVH